jgi:hypothetical protein
MRVHTVLLCHVSVWRPGGSVDIVNRLRVGGSEVWIPARATRVNKSCLQNTQISYLVNLPQDSCPGVRRSQRDVEHSHRSDAQVKNEWSYTSSPPICLRDVDTDDFIFNWEVFKWLM